MGTLSLADRELLPYCPCDNKQKALYYCADLKCVNRAQSYYCELCNDAGFHDHGKNPINKMCQAEGVKWGQLQQKLSIQHSKIHAKTDQFVNFIDFLTVEANNINVSLPKEIQNDILTIDTIHDNMGELENRIKGLVVNFQLLELLSEQEKLLLIESDLKATEYLEQLDDEMLWQNFKEVMKKTKSSAWMDKLDTKMKEYYQHFLHKVRTEPQDDESPSIQQSVVVASIADNREFIHLSNQLTEMTQMLRNLGMQFDDVKK